MPDIPCPLCLKDWTSGGWDGNGLRRIVGLHQHEYIYCKRYRCSHSSHRPYTFLGYDSEVIAALPAVVQNHMPAVITRRSAISKEALSVTNFLAVNGCGFETIERLFKTLNYDTYHQYQRTYLQHVAALNCLCRDDGPQPRVSLFIVRTDQSVCPHILLITQSSFLFTRAGSFSCTKSAIRAPEADDSSHH